MGHVRAAATLTSARQSCAECEMSAAVDTFGQIIGGRFLYVVATAEVGCVEIARVPIDPVGHACAAATPTGALLSCAVCGMSAAVDVFGYSIGRRLVYAAAAAERGCLKFWRGPSGPVRHAHAAELLTGARLSCAEREMSAAVDVLGHIFGGRSLYAAAMANVGCRVFARRLTAPVAHARAGAATSGARLSFAECEMSAAIDIFRHILGGHFLYVAGMAKVGCLIFGRVSTGPVRFACAAATHTGARLSCVECEMSAAVDIFGHIIGGRFLYAAATAQVGCLVRSISDSIASLRTL